MNPLEIKLSRRELLLAGGIGLGLAGAGAVMKGRWQMLKEFADWISPPFDLARLNNLKAVSPDFPAPYPLGPLCFNSPFLWRAAGSEDALDQAANKIAEFTDPDNNPVVRIFIDDSFEGPVGHFHPEVIERVKMLSKRFKLAIDLFDAYPLLHSDKSICYHSFPPNSPYLDLFPGDLSTKEKQMRFFSDSSVRQAFLERVENIVGSLKDEEGIVAWSISNELDPPVETVSEKRKVLTPFYEDVIRVVRTIDKVRPVLSGVANPNFLDERVLKEAGLTANTIHVYDWRTLPGILEEYCGRQCLPLVCQEIGMAGSCNGIDFRFAQDQLSYRFLQNVFSNFFEVDYQKGIFKPRVTSLWLWQVTTRSINSDGYKINHAEIPIFFEVDYQTGIPKPKTSLWLYLVTNQNINSDGYEIDPAEMPTSRELLQTWQRIISKSMG